MTDAIAFLIALLVAGGGLLALFHWLATLGRRRAEMTDEEYQESIEHEKGLIGAGMMAFDQTVMRRGAERAIEYRIDAEQGHLPGGEEEGETPPDEETTSTPQ